MALPNFSYVLQMACKGRSTPPRRSRNTHEDSGIMDRNGDPFASRTLTSGPSAYPCFIRVAETGPVSCQVLFRIKESWAASIHQV